MSNRLLSISPIDGRYHKNVKVVSNYFSEYALIKYRIFVEISYYITLIKTLKEKNEKLPIPINNGVHSMIDVFNIITSFNIDNAISIKEIEKVTLHDVKAVEYFITKLECIDYPSMVHFGLTSQDINNVSLTLMVKNFIQDILTNELYTLQKLICDVSLSWLEHTIISKTHGQSASPTSLGKEFAVFLERIISQIKNLNNSIYSTKFGGAVGNFNAHLIAYPNINWLEFADNFIELIGLKRQQFTTQIEHYDELASIFNTLSRISIILIDLCRDVWLYISMGYFKLKTNPNEIGSSTMPHKVNPIDFENAEGNLMYAVSIFDFISRKLPISRLQRDLTDSTVSRNIGVPMAHMLLSIKNIIKGINKLEPNIEVIERDINNNNIVISEGIQTILRREGHLNAYEIIKDATRGKDINEMNTIISDLNVSDTLKEELYNINVYNYIGFNEVNLENEVNLADNVNLE
jgi:adenylosuccinate lyase